MKPSLRDRLRALENKHAGAAGQAAAQRTGPERTQSPEPELSSDDAAQVIRDGLGPMAWERSFATHTSEDGRTVYVDTQTGQVYDAIPKLDQSDGSNA